MANITPVWTRFGYDAQGTFNTPTDLSSNISTIYNVKGITSIAQSQNVTACINYNNDLDDEIFYISTSTTVYAFRSNLHTTKIPTQLWSYVPSNLGPYSPLIISISNSGKYLFITDRYGSILNALDGSFVTLLHPTATTGVMYPIAPDPSGNFVIFFDYYGSAVKINRAHFDETTETASIISTTALTGNWRNNPIVYNPNLKTDGNSYYEVFIASYGLTQKYKHYTNKNITSFPLLATYNNSGKVASNMIVIEPDPWPCRLFVKWYSESQYDLGLSVFDADGSNLSHIATHSIGADQHMGPPATLGKFENDIATLYYRVRNKLYCIQYDYNSPTILTEKWAYPNLSVNGTVGSYNYLSAVTTSNDKIIVPSPSSTTQVQIFKNDPDSDPNLLNAMTLSYSEYCLNPVSIGNTGLLYIPGQNYIHIYGTSTTPVTTTTTTTTAPTTTTTTTTGTGTTTTTTSTTPTTTTTTTTPSPLSIVQTTLYELVGSKFTAVEISSASDSSDTVSTPFAKSFNFGTIAPGEDSKTLIIALNIPNVKAITNIKIGLVDIGGITFSSTMFGFNSSIELRSDITPDYHFQGVNINKEASSPYNMTVANKDNYTSVYVYLNITLPRDQEIGTGLLKYKWFFDYAD